MYLQTTSESYLESGCLILKWWSSWLLFISRWQTSSKFSRCLNTCFWVFAEGLHLDQALQSVLHLTPVIIQKIRVHYSSPLTMSLRTSENAQIRLCKKSSATQNFLLKHGAKKCPAVIFTIACKLNILQMQENQICFPSSCWGSSKLVHSQERGNLQPRNIFPSSSWWEKKKKNARFIGI